MVLAKWISESQAELLLLKDLKLGFSNTHVLWQHWTLCIHMLGPFSTVIIPDTLLTVITPDISTVLILNNKLCCRKVFLRVSWHSFSNFEVFLNRECQSCVLVQSHIVDRHHIPQNLIWSQGLFFLVNSSKTKSLISRKEECFLHQKKSCFLYEAAFYKDPTSKKSATTTKNKPEKPKPIHTHTHTHPHSTHWNYLSPLIIISYRPTLRWLERNTSCSQSQILHEGI